MYRQTLTVTLYHETGRIETIPHAVSAGRADESTIKVEYYMDERGTTTHVDVYDGLSWSIDAVRLDSPEGDS